MDKAMTKPCTLKLNKEFKRAYYQGKSKASPYFVCYLVKNRGLGIRYGMTASKKMGNAVARNRARRLIRAAFFSMLSSLENNRDYVFVARERILSVKSDQVAFAMRALLKQLHEAEGNPSKAKKKPEKMHQKPSES